MAVVVAASVLAGCAGVLAAYDTDLTPTMGFYGIFMGIVAVVIGGVGSIAGAYCGGLLLGLMQRLGAALLPLRWQDPVVFVVLIVFLVFRPRGIFGVRQR